MQEMWVRFLGQEDPLEKEMATHSRILVWEIPWTEESGRLQSIESTEGSSTHACKVYRKHIRSFLDDRV